MSWEKPSESHWWPLWYTVEEVEKQLEEKRKKQQWWLINTLRWDVKTLVFTELKRKK